MGKRRGTRILRTWQLVTHFVFVFVQAAHSIETDIGVWEDPKRRRGFAVQRRKKIY